MALPHDLTTKTIASAAEVMENFEHLEDAIPDYTPAAPTDWATTAPATIAEALDRIAAAVANETAAPIP